MRVAIGGIVHETNTYAVESFGPTTLDAFKVLRGDDMFRVEGTRTFIGGMIDGGRAGEHELVPTLHAFAQPSGTIEAGTYTGMKAELLRRLTDALPVDAVALDLHGAGIVDGIDDLEADLGEAVRAVVGTAVPIVVTLDLHGSITQEMNEVFDLMLGVYEYPHVDMYERGVEAIESLERIATGELRPVTHVEPLPMMLPTATTDISPAGDIRDRCLEAATEPGMVRAAFFHGFPFTDIPQAGASIVATTNGDADLARSVAQRIAAEIWERRDEFRHESLSPDIAIRQAHQLATTNGGPVVVNDTADNPGGGTPGDATHVLRALLDAGIERACFGFIYDPGVAEQAHAAGAGASIEVSLGGHHDDLHGDPIETVAYVKTTSDGRFVHSTPMIAGVVADYGKMARLQIPGPGGIDVLVGSARSQVFDPEVFTLHGIDVTTYDVVVLKSSQHFRAGFSALASGIVTADSPGLTTLRVENFDHPRLDGPRWPLDPETTWTPS